MYIEKTNSRGKYTCYLLRETYREDGKVKHRTIANLSGCSEEEIQAMRLALKHKKGSSGKWVGGVARFYGLHFL